MMDVNEALTSKMYIDYNVDEINTITSAILCEIEEDEDIAYESMIDVKKIINTVIYTLVANKEFCDEVLAEFEEMKVDIRDDEEQRLWDSLDKLS